MSEPVRWLADSKTAPELRELLDGAADVPALPPLLHERLTGLAQELSAGGLAAGGAAVASSSLVGKTLASLGSMKLVAKFVVGSALLGAASVTTYVATRPAPSSLPAASKESDAPAVSKATSPGEPSAPRTRAVVDVPGLESTGRGVSDRPSTAAPADRREDSSAATDKSANVRDDPAHVASFPDSSLAEEARLLESARAALAADPARALRLTAEHEREHPMAQLSAEREFIAIDALLRLGRREEALQRAAPPLAQAPGSLYAKRLRQLLGLLPP